MDIDYLLALQEARESLPDIVSQLFYWLSFIGDGPALVAIMCVVYWCIDKRAGIFAMACMSLGNFANQLMKNIACVYRPWIRDARIVPLSSAIEGAGGYSFPSGHTTGATTAFGGIAWKVGKRHRAIAALLVVLVLLIMFSRNFLGVHTPQDVIVGLLLGIVAIVVVQLLANWIERCDAMLPGHNRDIAIMVVCIVAAIASIVVVVVKPYPMDYVEGVLLVDPVAMQKGSFEAAGLFAGFAIAWVLERRIIRFETDGAEMRTRVVRGIVGIAIVGAMYIVTDVVFKSIMTYIWAKLFALFFVTFTAVFLVPLVFTLIERKLGW